MNVYRIVSISVLLFMTAACGKDPAELRVGASSERGKIALTQYACQACHLIPGITGSQTFVGPPLEGIRHPKSIDPQTAMPDMGVTEEHARDMAAYLSTLK
jgi:cytochrome c